MRILLLNQFFWPDGAPTAVCLTDLARRLAENGHSVTVLCGRSSYSSTPQTGAAPAVQVERVREWRFRRAPLARVLSYATFLVAAAWRALRVPRPELVLTMTTPPGLAWVGTLLKFLRGVRHVQWEMDLYPDIAVAAGAFSARNPLARLTAFVLDGARRRADVIVALGECMKRRLSAHGVPPGRIRVCEIWTDGRDLQAQPFPAPSPLRILYSGNLGMAHDVDTVAVVLHRLAGDSRFEFVFQGGGPRHAELQNLCRLHAISNVHFAAYCPRSDLAANLGRAHIGLVTQRNTALGSVVPSKLYTFMAAGRPVIFVGPHLASAAQTIRRFRCGWQVDCGDTGGMVALLSHLASHPDEIHAAGFRARSAFSSHYDLPIGVQRMTEAIGAARG